MEITTTVIDNKATLQVEGKLTVQTSPDLQDVIAHVDEKACDIDIDLSEVTYISSAGLRVLVAAEKLAVRRGGALRLLHPQESVMEVFDMTGLANVFTIEA
jgi:anti-sigma B factor antagonist